MPGSRALSPAAFWLLAVLVDGGAGLVINLELFWPLALLAGAAVVAILMIWDRHGTIASWRPGDHRPDAVR